MLPSRCYVTFCRCAQGWICEVVQGVGKMEKKARQMADSTDTLKKWVSVLSGYYGSTDSDFLVCFSVGEHLLGRSALWRRATFLFGCSPIETE